MNTKQKKMAKKEIIRIRVDEEMQEGIKKVSEALKLSEVETARILLNTSLKKLMKDIQKHGIENLEFSVKKD